MTVEGPDEGGAPEGQGWQGPRAQHLLGHHADLHTEDAGLLFGRGPLQAHVSAGEFHGEFHFDLVGGKAGTIPQGVSARGVPPRTANKGYLSHPGLPETPTGWEREGCRQRRGGRGWAKEAGVPTAPAGHQQRPGCPPTVQTLPISLGSPHSSQSHLCASSSFLQFVDPAAEKERKRT